MLEKAETVEPGDSIRPEEAIMDPFVLEFLDLKDEYSESELEEALIQHLTDFLLELRDDFAFLSRQRRLRIDDNWFRIDLILSSSAAVPDHHRPQGWQFQSYGRRPDCIST
jgi:predicted nuclease of restriction endonuclease-like (RecB) superfamily